MSKKSNRFSSEVHERAVRMVLDHRGEYHCLRATIESITPKIGACRKPLTTGFASMRLTMDRYNNALAETINGLYKA